MLGRALARTSARGLVARGFATRIYSPAGTYAHSLLDACLAEKADPKKVSANLTNWVQTMDDNAILKRFMDDTEFDWATKDAKLEEHVYAEAGLAGEAAEAWITREMISVCMEEDQQALLPEIAVDFETLVLDHVKEVKCHVTSASTLSAAQTKKVQAKLQSLVKKGETLTVTYDVDAALMGGLTLQIGDKFQDLSARSAIMKGEAALRAM